MSGQGETQIEAESWAEGDEEAYADSTLGTEDSDNTVSFPTLSDVLDYRNVTAFLTNLNYTYINGRQYHPPTYFPSLNQRDIDRYNLKHHLTAMVFGGNLFFAPISDHPQKILDVGTGSGMWAMDVATKYEMAHVEATDLNPAQPTMVPPNLEFLIQQDFNYTWNLPRGQYDLVHSRYNHLSVTNWRAFLRRAFDALRPGGYLEMHEKTFAFFCDDDTLPPDSGLVQWYSRCAHGLRINTPDREVDLTDVGLRRYMEEVGFEDIEVIAYKLPINAWAKHPLWKDVGRLQQAQLTLIVGNAASRFFRNLVGLGEEEATRFCELAIEDFKNKRIHAYQRLYAIYGRKPES